jgi:hypothetical protein
MSATRTVRGANRVQALTIDTTILVSTFFLSTLIGLPETPAVYRSSAGQSNVVFEGFSSGARTNSAKHAKIVLRG